MINFIKRNKVIFYLIGFVTIMILFPPLFIVFLFIIGITILWKLFFTKEGRKKILEDSIIRNNLKHPKDKSVCPKCCSEKVTIINEHNAFSLKKAALGGVLIGGIGTVAGLLGSHKNKFICLKCGHTWK